MAVQRRGDREVLGVAAGWVDRRVWRGKVGRAVLLPLLLLLCAPLAWPAPSLEAGPILAVLDKQVADWNAGNLDAFATGYKNASDILFLGKTVSKGYAQMLAAYKARYATREQMGTLRFSQLEVQALDQRFATTTGHFHLERTVAGGGNADGYFLLVLEKTSDGWKIVRDDTTALPEQK